MASHVEYIWVHPTSWGRADVIDASARWKAMSNGDDVMFGRDVCYLAPETCWYPVKFLRKESFEVAGQLYSKWDHCFDEHMSLITVVLPGLELELMKPTIKPGGVELRFNHALSGDRFKVIMLDKNYLWTCSRVLLVLRNRHGVRNYVRLVAEGGVNQIAGNKQIWSPFWSDAKVRKPHRRVREKTSSPQLTLDFFFKKLN